MIHLFKVEKVTKSTTRKFPFLPRFGVVVDVAGKRISFRQVPILETMLNLLERGPSLSNLQNIVSEQIQEVKFPHKRQRKTVNVKAKTVSRKSKSS
jgi:hypothetical protein